MEPQRLFYDQEDYRQKYYNLRQTQLQDKERWIGDAQKFMGVKEAIIQFIILPNENRAKNLAKFIDDDKITQPIDRYIDNHQKMKNKNAVLNEVMRILQIEHI